MMTEQNIRKKVSWNREQLVEVIYECYIPFNIRNSSTLLLHFTRRFDKCADTYIKELMKRNNLSRISAPSSNESTTSNRLNHMRLQWNANKNTGSQILQQKQRNPQLRMNPFKKKTLEDKDDKKECSLGSKDMQMKHRCTQICNNPSKIKSAGNT